MTFGVDIVDDVSCFRVSSADERGLADFLEVFRVAFFGGVTLSTISGPDKACIALLRGRLRFLTLSDITVCRMDVE